MMMQRHLLKGAVLVLFLALVATPWAQPGVRAQTDERCFPETGYCISGRIRQFWEEHGGLPVFGFPITPQQEEMVEGQPRQVQWFERNRLELHPENEPPYDVLLGRLGVDRLEQQGRNWFAFPQGQEQAGCLYFEQSRHSLCEPFLSYWQRNGLEFDGQPGTSYDESLALFGLPLSEPAEETNASGFTVLTQWFERARFEYYPENTPEFQVQLGLLGNEIRAESETAPPPEPAPEPPPEPPALPAPSFNECQADPNADNAPNYPVKIVTVDKAGEVVRLQNVSPEPVDLTGWIMCSITGNQRHEGIGGVLAPGETRDFPYTGSGMIWNNSERDDGALYNARRQLVSYWRDGV